MHPARPAIGFRTGKGLGVQGVGNRLQVPAGKVQIDHRSWTARLCGVPGIEEPVAGIDARIRGKSRMR